MLEMPTEDYQIDVLKNYAPRLLDIKHDFTVMAHDKAINSTSEINWLSLFVEFALIYTKTLFAHR